MLHEHDVHTNNDAKEMSIRIATDGICFYIIASGHIIRSERILYTDARVNQLTAFKELFFSEPTLAESYVRSLIFVEPSSSLLMAKDLIRSGDDLPNLQHLMKKDEDAILLNELLPVIQEPQLFFTLPKGIWEFAQRSFSMPKFSHPLSLIIPQAVLSPLMVKVLLMQVTDNAIYYAIAKQGALLHANTIHVSSEQEIIYFFTHIWYAGEMDVREDHLILYDDRADSQLADYLRDRLMNTDFHLGLEAVAPLYASLSI